MVHQNLPVPKGTGWKSRLTISRSTKELIMVKCKDEFLKHHPEMSGINITENFMAVQIAEYYLNN